MLIDVTRHKESVVIQAPLEKLASLIDALKKEAIAHTLKPLIDVHELLIPLTDTKTYEAFNKLSKNVSLNFLYLDYTHEALSERFRRKGRGHYKLKDKGDTGPVHSRVIEHFNAKLEPLNVPQSFYYSTLYYDMCHYILEDYITEASRYIYHSPHLVSEDYIQLIQSLDEKTLLKYKSHKLQVLEDLNLI